MLIWQKKNQNTNEMHSLHDLKLRSLKISRHQSNQLGLRREIRYLNSNRQHLNSRINNILIEIENINTRIGRLSSDIQKEEEKKKFYFDEQNQLQLIFSKFAKNPEPFFKNNQAYFQFSKNSVGRTVPIKCKAHEKMMMEIFYNFLSLPSFVTKILLSYSPIGMIKFGGEDGKSLDKIEIFWTNTMLNIETYKFNTYSKTAPHVRNNYLHEDWRALRRIRTKLGLKIHEKIPEEKRGKYFISSSNLLTSSDDSSYGVFLIKPKIFEKIKKKVFLEF